MEEHLSDVYRHFRRDHAEVDAAFEGLSSALHKAGPLGPRERRLVKLGIAIGANSEGAVRSHVRKALAEGIGPAELRHAVLLALTTAGFPHAIAALKWANDVIEAVSPSTMRAG